MWLLAGPIKGNWPSVTLWSVFQYPVTIDELSAFSMMFTVKAGGPVSKLMFCVIGYSK